MIKRFLTFALSVGFFIWLPNAFADGSGILSLDAPSHIRQTQNNHKDLLTLRVDNIQVRAGWEVTDADSVFTIKAERNAGVLQTVKTIVAPVIHVATIYVEDKFELLNPSYANLTASAVITVEFKSGAADKLGLGLKDAPRLTAVAGKAVSLHTFAAEGGSGTNTYTLVGGDDAKYFSVGATSGVLSLQASAQARVYTLTVEVRDDAGDTDKALATVEVSAALKLAEVPSFTVIASAAMSLRTFIASGGIGTPTYTILAGNNDGQFTLNAASGVLSLVADAKPDTYELRIQAMDAHNNAAETVVTVGVSAVLSLADAQRLGGAQGTAISLHTFAAQGGIGARTYTLLTDDVEDYFSLGAESGVLSLLASATMGTYTLSVEVRDSRGNVAQALATVDVALLLLADAPPLYAVVGREVSLHTFDAKGVVGTATYAITLDNDKNYFSIDAESGVLSVGADAAIGVYTLSVSVKDERGDVEAEAEAVVEVVASLSLATVPPLTVIAGKVAHTLTASGGIGTHTYTIVPGKDGFALDAASGVLSLRADAALGRHTLTLQVADARANTVQVTATVGVSAVLDLAAAPSFTVIASVAMSLHTFVASGGIGIKTYTLVAGDDDVKYFAVDATGGVFSLSMNAPAREYMLTVRAMDARDNTVETVVTVGVSAVLELATVSLLEAIEGKALSLYTFAAGGGIGSKTYTILADNKRYFSVGADSGVLSLSVNNAEVGRHTLTVQVMDARSNTAQVTATVGVSAVLALAAAPSSLTVIAGVGMSLHTFIASGGIGTPTYTIFAGNEGRDFTLNAASGVLSVSMNAKAGIHTLTVRVMDARDNTADTVATVEVLAALALAEVPPLTVIVGRVAHTLTASGGSGARTYTIVAGKDGFAVDANGVLSLSVNAGLGRQTLTLQVADARNTVQAVVTVEVSAALSLAAAPSSFTVIASVGMNLHTFIASGGIGTPTYTILAGNEGKDFTLNATSGALSLSVNAKVGSHTLTVRVMDGRDNTADTVVTVEVSAALMLAAAPSFTVIASVGMDLHTFIASGGIGTPTYTIVAGNEGRDFTLNAASGVLSLSVNAKVGSHTLTVRVMDERGNTAETVATVGVSAVLSLVDAKRLGGLQGITISLHTFAAQGGIGSRTYTLLTDDVENYFSLGAESGVLSLLASATVGIYTLSVEVRDSRGNVAKALATVDVAILFLENAPTLYAVVGREVSLHTFAAKGGDDGALSYTITAGNDKRYFSLDAKSGALSVGVSATIGVYTLSVLVKDGSSDAEALALAVVEVRASLSVATVPLLTVIAGKVAHTFIASGGIGTPTYTIAPGKEGFAVGATSGVLSLSVDAEAGRRHTLTLQAVDARANTVYAVATVEVSAALVLVEAPSFTVIASVAMSLHTFVASGGIGVKTYTLVAGDDDVKYFAVDAAGGVFSLSLNTPAKDYTLTVRAMDARDNTVETVVTVGVSAVLSLAEVSLLEAIAGKTLSLYTFAAGGGIGSKTYTILADDKRYFSVGADSGVLSLSVNNAEVGRHTLTVQVMDARSNTAQVTATVGVSAVLALAAAPSSFTVIASVGMNLHTFIASGGIGTPTYTIVAGNEGRDFTLNATSGVLSLSVNAKVGSHTLTVRVMDGRDNTADTVATVEVSAALSLAVASPLTVIVGRVAHTFIASGGIGIPTYTIVAGSKDFTLNAASGALSLSVNARLGRHTLTVQVMDEDDNIAKAVVTVEVSAVLELAAAPSSFTVIASVGMNLHTFIASGGIGTPTYTIVAGNEGKDFTLNAASGVLSLSVNAKVGSHTLTVRVMDGRDNTADTVATVEVLASLSLATVPPLTVIVGRVAHTLMAGGGIGTPTYTIVAGSKDFTLNAANGVLSLSMNAKVGSHTLTVQVMDEDDNIAKAVVTVEVSAVLSLAVASPLTVIVGRVAHTLTASGGIGIPTYAIVSVSKDGFTLNAASGALSLSMNAKVGSHTLTVQVMDERDNIAKAVVTVEVSAALSLAAAPSSFTVIASVGMSLHTFIASGGIGTPTYTIVAGNEGRDFTLNATSGVLSLSVNAEVGKHTLTVRVMDGRDNTADTVATVEVSAALALAAAPAFTVIASVGMNLHTFIASGGIGTPTYTILAGNEGRDFTLNAASGVLSLSVNAKVGSHTLTVRVMDERGNTAETVATVGVSAVLSLADAQHLSGIQGVTVSLHIFAAQGGIGSRIYTLLAGDAKGYFSLDAESGVLSLLTVAPVGTYTLSVQVRDDRGNVADALATVDVAFLFLADAPPLFAVVGREVSLYTFDAEGVVGVLTYTITAGNDKDYFSIVATSGVLSVRATAAIGVYTLLVSVKDGRSSAEARAVVEVRASLSVVAVPPLTVIAGRVAHTLTVSGGIGTHTYAIVPSKEGFAVGATSGVLSLSVNAEAGRRHTLTLQVADARANTVHAVATVEVSAALALAEAPSFTVIASVAMNLHTFVASGGIGIKTYTLVAGDDEKYFAVDAASGVFSLSMNAPVREYMLTVQAMDERDNTVETVVTVGVSAALALAEAPSFTVIASVAMSLHTFVASGGIGIKTYTLVAGDDEKYFAVDAASGVFSLSLSTPVREYTLTVQAMDERDNTVETVVTVGVSAALALAAAPSSFTVIASVGMSLHTFIASGGVGSPTYTILAGNDGGDFTLNATSGVLSLSVNAEVGSHTLTVQVMDGGGNTAQAVAMVEVSAALVLAAAPSFTVIASVGMNLHTFIASGGIGTPTYTIVAGNDGRNFTLNAASGVLSLTVDATPDTYTLSIQARDARGNTAETVATVEVSAALSLAAVSLLEVIEGSALSLTLAASGGIGSKTYTLTAGDKRYFSVDAGSGVLVLSANAEVGRHTLTVQVMDARRNTAQAVATVGVSAVLALAEAPSFTVIASVGMNLHTFIASGGIGTPTYTIVAGNEGRDFTLNATSGVLSLSVNAKVGSHTLTVQVMDERDNRITAVVMVGVSAVLSLAKVDLVEVIEGNALSLTLVAGGGIGSRTYTLTTSNEGYFSVGADSGVLSLSVGAEVGRYTLTVQVMDERDNIAQAVATVGVSAALTLAAAPSFTVIASVAMNLHTFIASGGIGVKTYTLAAGDERYFSVGADSGVLSLSLNAEAGRYTLTVQVMDGRDNSIAAVVMVGVSAKLALADAPLLQTVVGEAGNLHTFAASGGIGDKTYTVVAGNEDYFNLDSSSGVLSMNVTASVGMYTLSVQAADTKGHVATALATVEVASLLLRDVILYAIEGREVSLYTFEAGGGSGDKTYTIVAGSRHFTIAKDSGVLSVQSSVTVGVYTLSMLVTDTGDNRSEALAVVVVEASLFLADAPSLAAVARVMVSLHTFAAGGGIGAKTYTLAAAGDGADYFILNAASGVLSVANATVGVYTLSVTVSDSRGNSAQARGTVEVVGVLSLADALSLVALARLSVEVTLTTFAASGGYGTKRYEMIADESDYFALADSGELSLPPNGAMLAGEYTLSVAAADSLVPPQRATAAVVVRIAKNGIFVIGGRDDGYPRDVWLSLDGKNWSKQSDNNAWPGRYEHQVASHQGRLYLLGGGSHQGVWSSADGSSWSPEGNKDWAGRYQFQVVEYKERLYAMGGNKGSTRQNDVWSSEDGKIWTQVTMTAAWSARQGHQVVVHNGRMYLLGGFTGGYRNDVWSSTDGRIWSFEGNANWSGRSVHQAVSHQGRLYVLGGRISNDSSDVWSWAVGEENWTPETSNGWPARDNFQAVSYDGLLYVMGGQDNSNSNRNDVWSSADGKEWTSVTVGAVWSARESPQAVVFPPPLVIWGVGASEAIILTVGVPAAETVIAQYGLGPYTYSLTPKNIGIKIDGDGVLSLDDDQAQAGTYAVTVRVEDQEKSRAEIIINIEIRSFALADASPLFVFAGLAEGVSLHAFTAIYGVGASTYELVGDESGYFTLGTESGVLSVTANVAVGVYTLSVEVSDEDGKTATAVATVESVPILSLADAPLLSVVAGKAVSLHTFTAVGGSKTKTYNLVDASGFFALGEGSGILSVQAVSEVGIYTVSVRVSDESGQAAARAIVEVIARLSLADASLMAVEKKAVSLHTFAASGGIGARTYTLSAGNETGYFVLDASGGVLSLSASASAGAYALTVGVKDGRGNVATAVATVNISAALSLADAPPLPVVHGEARDLHTFVASGGLGVKTYTVAAGAAYFTVGVSSGVLSVDANATVGMYTLSVQAADTDGNVVQALATVEVAPLLLLDAPMLYAIVGQEVSLHTFETDGGSGAKVFTIVAGNKKYFTIAAGSGVLSVQAKASVGIYTLSVAVDDEDGNQAEGLAVVAVEASLFLADMPSLVAFTEMTMSLHTFAASGGIGAKTYTLSAVEGQEYFTLNATSGVLSAVNAAAGVYTLSVTVSDSRGNSAQARGTVQVLAFLSLADAPSLEALARLSVTVTLHTFAAGGGYGAKRYTLIADEAGYFALDAASGELSLPSNSAMLAGTYTLLVGVSDGLSSQRATAAATVQIARNRIFVTGGNDGQGGNQKNDVWSSADGESWRQDKANTPKNANVGWTPRQLHQAVAHNGRLYVMGGADGSKRKDVWWSVDGANWQREADAAWTGREIYQAVSYKGRIYVLGGVDEVSKRNDVWSSADGVTWRQDKANNTTGWTARDRHQAVVHNDRLYVLGGQDSGGRNDVWSSANGSSWRFEGNADWDARYFHQAVSHGGRLYVLGGSDRSGNEGGVKSDVWSSVDGRSWVREKEDNNVSWSKRFRHQSLSRDGLLYVLGGNANGLKKDVWSSADGKTWEPETDAAWTARMFHQAVVFPPHLVLSGTSETITLTVGVAAELHTFSAQYGFGQYAYSLPSKIEGFSIDGAGVLSADNQAQAGAYTLTVRVEDEEGGHAESIVNIEIYSFALADAPPLFAVAGLAESVSLHAFTAVYGVGESTYELVGDDSGYFTLGTASGVLSVTANVAVGVYTVSVEVSDESGNQAAAVATVEALPMLSLADAPLLSVVAGKALELHTFTAVGGIKAKTYNLVGTPAGYFTLGASSGILSVQATSEVGIYTVSVEVSDSAGNQATAQATVEVIARLSLADASLMAVEKKAVSLHTFVASGGIGARTYTLSLGNETGYFVLDAASGVLSLSASASAGEYTLTVEVKDERANIAVAVATVNISAALSLAGVSQLLVVAEGEAAHLHTFVASGGLGVKTYTVAAGAGYFTIGTASGVLSVDANAPVGIYTLSVQAADTDGNVVEALATAQVVSLLLADVMLYAIVGREVSLHTFEAGGGGGAKTYTIVAGNEDKYFTLDAVGVLSVQGSVTVGIYTLFIAVDDEGGNRAEVLAVVAVEASLFLADAPPLTVMAGLALSLHTFAASGGIGVKAYTIAAGNEAKYFILNAASGVLSLRATAPEGLYTLTVQAADEYDNLVEAVATVDVSAALSLSEAPLLEAVVGMTMSVHTFAASGGIGAKTYTLSADNGVGYFAINATSGVLSVANATVGVYTLSVKVSDSRRNQVEARATVQVAEVLSLADAPLLEALARLSVTVTLHTFVASGGIGSKRYTIIAGNEADYFALDAGSGELLLPKNSAMLAGEYTLSVAVSDSLTPPQRATAAATVQIARNGIFVLGGQDSGQDSGLKNDVWWSADGKNWTSDGNADWAARANYQAVAYHGRLYVLGGDAGSGADGRKSDVWWSADGKNWVSGSNASWFGRRNHQAVQHRGRLYVLGGYTSVHTNDVWSWADGESSWSPETGDAAWPARRGHQAVSHNGRIYVMGGRDHIDYFNDVWSSADGKSWVNESNAPWSGRYDHQAVSHMGRLYVLGGNTGTSGSPRRSDVWSSLDGRSWRQEKADDNSAWEKREEHQALSHDGRLYVLGGNAGTFSNGYINDVWWSTDGKSWEKEPGNAAWSVREAHQAVVFPPNLVLSGTSETITLTLQAGSEIYPFSAQYGGGQYTYSLTPEIEGFKIGGDGVLSADEQVRTGVYALTVRVEDEEGSHAESIVNIDLRVIALADAPPLFAVAGLSVAVSLHAFTFSHGIGAYTYDLVDDKSGYFTLGTASGVLSVSANVAVGVYTLSVTVRDESGNEAAAVATVEVLLMLSLADAPLLSVVAGKALGLHTFTAVGGIKAKTYNLVDEKGYFTLGASSGILSVQAVSEVGIYTVSVEVSDSAGNQATAQATVGVIARLSLAGASLMAVEKKTVILHTFAASGGIGARTYTLSAGNETGYFVLDAASGVLSLSASASAGEYMLTVRVKDERDNIATAVATVNISAALSLADAPQLLFAAEGEAKNLHTFVASGGLGAKTYTLVAGARYFTVGAASGVLSVDANAPLAMYTLSVQVADADGNVVEAVATAQVVSLLLADVMLYAIVGREVSLHTFEAGGGIGIKTYTIVAGNEDKYFRLDADSGVLSVQSSATVGIYTLYIAVDDKSGNRVEVLAVVAVEASLFLADAPPLTVMAGLAVSVHTFATSGGIGTKTYTIAAGNEAKYFTLNAASGVLSLRAAAPEGFYTLTVQAADEDDNQAKAVATVDVWVALSLAEVPLLVAFTGMTMSLYTFAASGGIGAKTYTLAVAEGQEYFTLNATSGVLSVASATVGVYTLSVTVSDSRGNQVEARAPVQVVEALSLAGAPSLDALARLSVTVTLHTFVAGGGYGAKRYTLIADEASYFALDADSGELLLPKNSAMLAGEYTLSVAVSDSLMSPQRATAAATVRIARNGIFVLGGKATGNKNDVWRWSAAGGNAWKRETANASWSARYFHQAVAYHGRLYVMGGQTGLGFSAYLKDVWSSADGKNWVPESTPGWGARTGHQAVAYQGRLYVSGGDGGRHDVWSWAYGENWKKHRRNTLPGRQNHQVVVHNGRLYALGGRIGAEIKNDVWSSADGTNWMLVTLNAPWATRYDHQAVSHMGRLYVLGGNSSTTNSPHRRGDVWSSLDGRSWRQEKADDNGAWGKRHKHQALSRDGRLYVLGGNNGGYKNDVWWSTDGKSWEKESGNAAWSAREAYQAVVFPPSLALSGTSETIILTEILTEGVAEELYTFSAQYGFGQYTYSLALESEAVGFDIDESSGVLSADSDAAVGGYTLTVQVEDEEGSQAETVVQVEIVAASTAALSAGSSIISPPASGGGASALALAGGGLSLLIITPPASSLARPRTPPTSAGGENIGQIPV